MKFSIGDRILLKRTGEEGLIVAFLSKVMMEVEVAGVCFPVYNDDVDHPYLKWFTEKKKQVAKVTAEIPVEKAANRVQRLARGIYLSFLPQFNAGEMDDIIESFRIHFINETPDTIAFIYNARYASGSSLFQHKATLHPFGHIYLHPISLEEINGQPRFYWEVLPVAVKDAKPVSGLLRIRPAQLVRYIHEMLEENNPAFSILLAQDAEQAAIAAPPSPALPPPPTVSLHTTPQIALHTTPEAILDLHINTLRNDAAPLSPEEILHTQLTTVQQKLQAALATGMERMIIIHGLGKGILRQKVHEILADTARVQSFSNHWMGGYGWGATEVIFDVH